MPALVLGLINTSLSLSPANGDSSGPLGEHPVPPPHPSLFFSKQPLVLSHYSQSPVVAAQPLSGLRAGDLELSQHGKRLLHAQGEPAGSHRGEAACHLALEELSVLCFSQGEKKSSPHWFGFSWTF